MEINYGKGKTEYGPGVQIDLTGEEIATAIYAYLSAHNVHVSGPATINVNGDLIDEGGMYVDPSGYVVADGIQYDGKGDEQERLKNRDLLISYELKMRSCSDLEAEESVDSYLSSISS